MKRALLLLGAAAAAAGCSDAGGRYQLTAGRLERVDTRATTPAMATSREDAVLMLDTRTGETWKLELTVLDGGKTVTAWTPLTPPMDSKELRK